MREPLLFPLVAVVCGILLDEYLPLPPTQAAWPAVVFLILAAIPVRRSFRLANLALAFVFGGAFLSAWHRPLTIPTIDTGAGETALAEGCVVAPTVFSNDGARFTLEIAPQAYAQVEAPNLDTPLAYGQRVDVEARFREPHNYNNPGAFDYASYLARRHIYWTALVPAHGSITILPGECGSRWLGWIFSLRTAALTRIDNLYPDNDYASGMLEAVLIGESAKLERVWTESFRRSGTYHALVISGMHISVLAGVLLFLLRFAPISPTAALTLTAIVAWVYALVSGFSVPVARSAAGFTVYLVAHFFFRRVRPLNLLAGIALVFLAFDPPQLFEASFQLSFLSIAALAALAGPILERVTQPLAQGARNVNNLDADPHLPPRAAQLRVELRLAAETITLWTGLPLTLVTYALSLVTRVVLFAAELAIISFAVQLGLALPMAEYFHRISFTGLSANMWIVPLMNAVVPVGFLALFTGWHWAASLADTLLRSSAMIAEWHADLEPGWRVPDPPLWLALSLVAVLLAAAYFMRRKSVRWPLLATGAVLLALLVRSPWKPDLRPGMLELTAIDVGQGDSLLLVFPEGKTMLIDGGGKLEFGPVKHKSNLDTGEDVVSSYLWTRGLHRLDVIVATHAHQDHIGGLPALLENFHPDELWTGANPSAALSEEARTLGVRVIQKQASPPIDFAGARIEVLAPTLDYLPKASAGNNDSLVLRVTYGARSFLLTGDLEAPIERELLANGSIAHADVLKVGHHGSKTSTTQNFLDAVSPSIAMISAGYENSFGHPHPDVQARLQARHSTILRTDLAGLATVRTDGQRLWFDINAWHPAEQRLDLPEHLIH